MFQFLNNILYKKKRNTLTADNSQQYNNYMINRWCSMHSPHIALIINETMNKFWPVIRDKQEHYEMIKAILPPVHFKKIAYIKKKQKTEKEKNRDEVYEFLAAQLELSTREVKAYCEEAKIDVKELEKQIK
tara:strand:+ start:1823 stop:2215 length:393 start_codon:yes stop_codon:yes gene_type:complete